MAPYYPGMTRRPTIERPIVAMGGGGFSEAPDATELRTLSAIDSLILDLARDRRGRSRPNVCLIGTAMGDAAANIGRFHAAFDPHAEATHLGLFDRTVTDIPGFLLDQDAIYVGGGNTASLLAVWSAHGVDQALATAHEAGVVLAGRSAGSICWFESGTTDSYGPPLQAVHGGLGFIRGSHSPHFDGEPERRPTYHRLISTGVLPAGLAADDGAALVFDGPRLVESVSERDGAGTYRVELVDGQVEETGLPTRRMS
jgi:peptidase E